MALPRQGIKQSDEKAATIVQDLMNMARRWVPVNEGVNLKEILADS